MRMQGLLKLSLLFGLVFQNGSGFLSGSSISVGTAAGESNDNTEVQSTDANSHLLTTEHTSPTGKLTADMINKCHGCAFVLAGPTRSVKTNFCIFFRRSGTCYADCYRNC